MSRRHSVDGTPWVEEYEVGQAGLVLTCTELRLMGVGAPFDAPRVELDGDTVRLCGTDRPFPAVRWIHSQAVGHRVLLDGELVLPARMIPHHTKAEMTVIGELQT